MKKQATWYYDLVSPYAYLQAAALPALADRLDITAVPILFAGVLRHWGHLGPAEIPAKRLFIYRHAMWRAEQRGLTFRMPPAHPFNPLQALRLLSVLAPTPAHALTALAYVFGEGGAVDTPAGLQGLAARLGASPETMQAASGEEAKILLRNATESATAAGVFGVPTFLVDGRLFWGDDSEGMLRSYLDDAAGFDHPDALRLATLPEAATRKRG